MSTELDTQYDYTGSLFPTQDGALMTGPFQVPGARLRVTCELGVGDRGEHQLSVRKRNKDSSLAKKPVAIGYWRKTADFDPDAEPPKFPVGRGRLVGRDKIVQLVIYYNKDLTGRKYLRIAPDNNQAEANYAFPRI